MQIGTIFLGDQFLDMFASPAVVSRFFIGQGKIVFVAMIRGIDLVSSFERRNGLSITALMETKFTQLMIGLKLPGD